MGHLGDGIVQVTRENHTIVNNNSNSARREAMDGFVRTALIVGED